MGTGMGAFHVIIRALDSGTVAVLVMLVCLLGMLCALVLPASWRTGGTAAPDLH